MIIAIMTQDAKSYTEQSMLREAVRSLDMTVLHYDADCIIAFVDREPEIKHVILTESETRSEERRVGKEC